MLWDEEDRKSRVEQMAMPRKGLKMYTWLSCILGNCFCHRIKPCSSMVQFPGNLEISVVI